MTGVDSLGRVSDDDERSRRRAIRDAYVAFEEHTPYVMTVRELIERLSSFDPQSPVVIEGTCPHGAYMRELDIYIDVDQGPSPELDEVDLTWAHDEERAPPPAVVRRQRVAVARVTLPLTEPLVSR